MKEIGGYFCTEKVSVKEYYFHNDLLALNTGRNCLEYILLSEKIDKIYLPFFSCSVLFQPLKKNNIKFELYNINERLEPIFNYEKIGSSEAILVINYFGILDTYLKNINSDARVIIDNSQAFFSEQTGALGAFYSARKFFGVTNGAYLKSRMKLEVEILQDNSELEIDFLTIREKFGARKGYESFKQNEEKLSKTPILKMSEKTKNILLHLDYIHIAEIRRNNFNILNNKLESVNLLKFSLVNKSVPLCYPLLLNKDAKNIKEKFLSYNIFIPTYWPDIAANKFAFENSLVNNMLCLPIDHRYSSEDMNYVLSILLTLI